MHVFLDIDGVLNRSSDWKKGYTVRPECLARLQGLLKALSSASPVTLVFTSTWGRMLEDGWKSAGLGMLEAVPGLTIGGYVYQPPGRTRAEAVRHYIRKNGVGRHVIIDDDKTLFPDTEDLAIVFTDVSKGLTDRDCAKILALAGKK